MSDSPQDSHHRHAEEDCREHSGKFVQRFCKTCEVFGCELCMVEFHAGHQSLDLDAAHSEFLDGFRRHKGSLEARLRNIDTVQEELHNTRELHDTHRRNVIEQFAEIRRHIDTLEAEALTSVDNAWKAHPESLQTASAALQKERAATVGMRTAIEDAEGASVYDMLGLSKALTGGAQRLVSAPVTSPPPPPNPRLVGSIEHLKHLLVSNLSLSLGGGDAATTKGEGDGDGWGVVTIATDPTANPTGSVTLACGRCGGGESAVVCKLCGWGFGAVKREDVPPPRPASVPAPTPTSPATPQTSPPPAGKVDPKKKGVAAATSPPPTTQRAATASPATSPSTKSPPPQKKSSISSITGKSAGGPVPKRCKQCGGNFSAESNNETACLFHPGKKLLDNTYSCCRLGSKGCAQRFHVAAPASLS